MEKGFEVGVDLSNSRNTGNLWHRLWIPKWGIYFNIADHANFNLVLYFSTVLQATQTKVGYRLKLAVKKLYMNQKQILYPTPLSMQPDMDNVLTLPRTRFGHN